MATDYTYLYEEYPEVISADQLYRICHISKRKAKWLLEHGYIPCEDSGKKTRRYKIRLNDVIDYLRTLEAAPDLVATPVGAFNVKRKQLNPVAQICQKEFQRFLYNIWTDEADILRISDVQVLLGYSAGTIRQWILRKELRSTRLPCGIQVTAKEWLIDFNKLFIAKPDGSPQRRDRMSANFGQLIRHLEMPHIRFHDLRHTAATNMHQLTGDFYTVGEILGHTLKGIGISLGISTNLEAVTAQYVDVRLERKQSVLQTYHKALQPKTTVTGKEAGQETSKKAKKKSNEMEL